MPDYKIASIVPALPPTINGVGDYAFLLSKALKINHDINTVFFNAEFSFESIKDPKKKPANKLQGVLEETQTNFLILHYVGYGYSKRGCPFWILNGIRNWKNANPEARLVVIFHELYASGKIWQSSFWLHYFQKLIAFKLLQLSDTSITTGQVTYNILKKKMYHKKVYIMPVFSNVGELDQLPEYHQKENILVLFGSKERRNELLANSLESLKEWMNFLGIKKIIEIGPLRKNTKPISENIELEQFGVLEIKDISKILGRTKYGVIQYPLSLLSKSGIFAAYASHGVIPIVLGQHKMNNETDNLKSGFHFLNKLHDAELKIKDLSAISANVFTWYKKHSLHSVSTLIADIIKEHGRSK